MWDFIMKTGVFGAALCVLLPKPCRPVATPAVVPVALLKFWALTLSMT